jgi:uncharacterized Zn finger protein (UPF0148 family)
MRTKATDADRKRWREAGEKLLVRTHLTDAPCPKCGRPTLEDKAGTFRVCMFLSDGFLPPMPGDCDYGVNL